MRDGPARIDEVLDEILAGAGLARPVDVAYLVEHWAEVAGEPWATRARPVRLERGELVVEALDGHAATLLRYQTKALVERLTAALGRGLVEAVHVRRSSG